MQTQTEASASGHDVAGQTPAPTLADFKAWGASGGSKANGAKKRRSKAHYRRMSAAGVEARRKKRAASMEAMQGVGVA